MSALRCTNCGSSVVAAVSVSADSEGRYLDKPARVMSMSLYDQRALRARHKTLGETNVLTVGVCVRCGKTKTLGEVVK